MSTAGLVEAFGRGRMRWVSDLTVLKFGVSLGVHVAVRVRHRSYLVSMSHEPDRRLARWK